MTSTSTRLADVHVLNEIKQGNLYALLSICTDHELQPLVDLIKDRVSSGLKSNVEYKMSPSSPSRYYVAIGDEICQFGGNSVHNKLRGARVEYKEIVSDVCKRLGTPLSDDIASSEDTLLELYLDEEWSTIPHDKHDEVVARARAVVAAHATSMENQIKDVSAKEIFGSLLTWNLVTSITNPAFRVTAPCVLQVAYLRRKLLEEQAQSAAPASFFPVPAERSQTLTVGEVSEAPLLALTRISDPAIAEWSAPDFGPAGISRLNPLLQNVPNLAIAQHVASTQYMEVVINGPLLKAKGTEGYRLITMIDGKPSHGVLLDPSSLSHMVNAAAVFQIVSVVVGQKHLADIKRKLAAINISLKSISRFQQNDRASKITRTLKYLEQIAQSVFFEMDMINKQALMTTLEGHHTVLLGVHDHLIEDIKAQNRAIVDIKDPDAFGTGGLQKAIAEHHTVLSTHYQHALLCIRARAANLQLSSALGLAEGIRRERRAEIKSSLVQLSEHHSLAAETNNMMRKKIQSLTAITDKSATIAQRKLELLKLNQQLLEQLKLSRQSIEHSVESTDGMLDYNSQPVRLLVKIENEQITGLQVA